MGSVPALIPIHKVRPYLRPYLSHLSRNLAPTNTVNSIPIHKAFERTKATPGVGVGRHSANDGDDDVGGGGGDHEVGAAVAVPLAHFGGSIPDELTCPFLSPFDL